MVPSHVQKLQSAIGRHILYGWLVVAVAVPLSLVMWGIRAGPSGLIKPLEADFGWSRLGNPASP